jgi:hypothetical protein
MFRNAVAAGLEITSMGKLKREPGRGSSVLERMVKLRRREIVERLVASESLCSGRHWAVTVSPLLLGI